MLSCTFYRPDGPAANGHSYAWNAARYGNFCASNHYPMQTRLLLTRRGGRRIVVTVADRIGHGSDVDCSERAFCALVGPRYRLIGRVTVQVRVLSRPHATRPHATRRGRCRQK